MAIEYSLTLAGQTPVEEIAVRVMPDPAHRPTPTPTLAPGGRLLSAGLQEQLGFGLSVFAGHGHSFLAADGDDGEWEWEPENYIDVTFRMSKDPDLRIAGIRPMLEAVARLLATGPEDAAFMLNGEVLLLTRFDGAVRKHNRTRWWDHYGFPNEIIPD
jgi:hypothetical protein